MQLPPELFGQAILWAGWLIAGLVLALSFSPRALSGLGQVPARQHLVLGTAVALSVLWSVRATVDPGVGLHILGMTAAVLLVGWRYAIWAGLLAELAISLTGTPALSMVGPNWLLSAVVPATLTAVIAKGVRQALPPNLFVFVFVCCFFGAGACVLAVHLIVAILMGLTGMPGIQGAGVSLSAFLPLVIFPEAFINGAVMSLLVVFQPDWVRLFDTRWYLDGR